MIPKGLGHFKKPAETSAAPVLTASRAGEAFARACL